MAKLALISEGVNTWPIYVAQSQGLFDQEGVHIDVTLTGSSNHQLDALKKGGYDIGFQQSDHVVRAVESGSDLFIFMGQSHAPELSLIVAPEIGRIADLQGKVIVVDGPRTGYSLLLRKLFADHGLKESDTYFKEFGGSQERFEAMKNGSGSACFLNPPFDRNLLAAGFRSLGTSGEFFPAYPGPIAAARHSWARDHKQELTAFIRGFNRAYAWLQNEHNTDEAIKLLPQRLNMDVAQARAAVRRIYSRPRPQITAESLQQVIDIVWDAEGYPSPKGKPDKYMDLNYLQNAGN